MKNFILAILLLISPHTFAEIVIIGNINNNQKSLTALEVQDIFMVHSKHFPNGKKVDPCDQSKLRTSFYQQLTKKDIEEINAYWSILELNGQTKPFTKLHNDRQVIKKIRNNKYAIGYVDKKNVNEKRVRILFHLK